MRSRRLWGVSGLVAHTNKTNKTYCQGPTLVFWERVELDKTCQVSNLCDTQVRDTHLLLKQGRSDTWMTESFTLSLFVYPHFLCTTFAASWLFVPWKGSGWGVMSRSYFTSCPSDNTEVRQDLKKTEYNTQKITGKSRKHLLRRASGIPKKCRLVLRSDFRWDIVAHCNTPQCRQPSRSAKTMPFVRACLAPGCAGTRRF